MSNQLTIAIADDHPGMRDALKIMLEEQGYEVIIKAVNGKDLIDQLATSSIFPDTLIVDLNMPVMDGRETIKELKVRWPEAQIIVFSMDNDNIEDLLQMGASAFLVKTSPTEMLMDTINRLNNVIK